MLHYFRLERITETLSADAYKPSITMDAVMQKSYSSEYNEEEMRQLVRDLEHVAYSEAWCQEYKDGKVKRDVELDMVLEPEGHYELFSVIYEKKKKELHQRYPAVAKNLDSYLNRPPPSEEELYDQLFEQYRKVLPYNRREEFAKQFKLDTGINLRP